MRETAAQQVIREVLEVQIASQGGELGEFEYRTEKNNLVVIATVRSLTLSTMQGLTPRLWH